MDIQYKPSKPKKEKSAKAPKAPKASKPMSFGTAKTVKIDKPQKVKEPKVKTPKPEKAQAVSFGKAAKVQTDKPIKVEKAQKPGILSKVDPKLILGGVLVLIAAVAAIMLTVVIPGVEAHGQEIQYISVSSTPDKTVYLVGDEANYDGLRITVTRNNGETFAVRANKCQITGFDSSEAKKSQTITVSYEGFTTTFFIKIEEPPKLTPALMSIKLETLPKTEYKLGEWLNTDGGVILCEYVDGSVYRLSLENSDVFGFVIDSTEGSYVTQKAGTYELTVKHMEQGIICETTYTITVTE